MARPHSTIPGASKSPSTLPALPSMAIGPSSCLRFQAVDIGIGTFAVVPADTTSADGKAMVVQKPVFQTCKSVKIFYQLKCVEIEIPCKKIFAYLSLCSPCLLLHAVVPVPRQSKESCNMERPSVGAHTVSQNLPLPRESAPSPQLIPRSIWMLVAGAKLPSAFCCPSALLQRRGQSWQGSSPWQSVAQGLGVAHT